MLTEFINKLTNISKWLALITMGFMMFFIAIGVVSRALFKPILGDVELVQLGMVVLIICGLAYTETVNGHISIGLFVDRLSNKIQKIIDIFTYVISMLICFIFSYIYFQVFINHLTNRRLSTDLLSIPYYPFDLLISIGFLLWGLQLLLKVIKAVRNDSKG